MSNISGVGFLVVPNAGAVQGAEIHFLVPMRAFECLSSPSMLMVSISYEQLLLWHIAGHIQFTSSNFQIL